MPSAEPPPSQSGPSQRATGFRSIGPLACALALTVLLLAHPIGGSTHGTQEPLVTVRDVQLGPGETATVPVRLSQAPDGVAGFNVTVRVADTETATVSDATVADAFDLTETTVAADHAMLVAADTGDRVSPGATDVRLGTITLRGTDEGASALTVVVDKLDSDTGDRIAVTTDDGRVVVVRPSAAEDGAAADEPVSRLTEPVPGNPVLIAALAFVAGVGTTLYVVRRFG